LAKFTAHIIADNWQHKKGYVNNWRAKIIGQFCRIRNVVLMFSLLENLRFEAIRVLWCGVKKRRKPLNKTAS
jgi:hypothetical protein